MIVTSVLPNRDLSALLHCRQQLEFGGMGKRKEYMFIGFLPVEALKKRYGVRNRVNEMTSRLDIIYSD